MWVSHSPKRSLTLLADGATTPESTSVIKWASCFCATRLLPRTYCVRYRFLPVRGSTPSKTRSCQYPGRLSRIEPFTATSFTRL